MYSPLIRGRISTINLGIALIALIALSPIAAGCGGSESTADSGTTGNTGTTTGKQSATPAKNDSNVSTLPVYVSVETIPLSKEQYIARVDKVCDTSWAFMLEGFEQRYRRLARAYRNEEDGKAEGRRFEDSTNNIFQPGLQAQFDDVQYVGAPAGDERQIARMLHALQQAVFNIRVRRITSARELSQLFGHFTTLAYHYGVNSCLVYESNFREKAADRERAAASDLAK